MYVRIRIVCQLLQEMQLAMVFQEKVATIYIS